MLLPIEQLPKDALPCMSWGWGTQDEVAQMKAAAKSVSGFWLRPTFDGLPAVHVDVGSTTVQETMEVEGAGTWVITHVGGLHFYQAFDLKCDDVTADPVTQINVIFDKMEKMLKAANIAPTQLARTWFYLDKVTSWYKEFNLARDAFFKRIGIYDLTHPASTGIGCPNVYGAAAVAGLLAVVPTNPEQPSILWEEAESPLQGPAPDYKSSFSRAAAVETEEGCHLYVSGTASIAPTGETQYLDDIEGQIARTMEVVEGILKARGMTWEHTTRAIAYIKEPSFLNAWQAWLKTHHLSENFASVLVADICRDDLLFELELDALKRA